MSTTYAIPNGRTVFDATLYTGSTTAQNIINADNGTTGFYPDLVWAKDRTGANDHLLIDSVRGVHKGLCSDLTAAETTGTSPNGQTSFNSNGFSLGTGDFNGTGSDNVNGHNFVAWQWNAGSGSTSTNTNGSITSTVSVNATAGFSIVTYTGNGVAGNQTVGHGLGVTPSMVMWKGRSQVGDWNVTHVGIPSQGLILDTAATATSGSGWTGGGGAVNYQNTNTSTTFGLLAGSSNNSNVNTNGNGYVAYCWAAVPGFSAFGSYTGNASADGPFVYCGFRPKFVLIKAATGSAYNWDIYDTSRDTYNAAQDLLYPNSSSSETTLAQLDILSNGFKIRISNSGNLNDSGAQYIYACFAENPFKYANAR